MATQTKAVYRKDRFSLQLQLPRSVAVNIRMWSQSACLVKSGPWELQTCRADGGSAVKGSTGRCRYEVR